MSNSWVSRAGQVYTIAVDFDGVIHAYTKGWHDGTIYDEPLPGAMSALSHLLDKYSVFIFTAREPEAVMPWLEARGFDVTIDERCAKCLGGGGDMELGIWTECSSCKGEGRFRFWDLRGQLLVTNRKLPAAAYIDDRGIRFETWEQTLGDLEAIL